MHGPGYDATMHHIWLHQFNCHNAHYHRLVQRLDVVWLYDRKTIRILWLFLVCPCDVGTKLSCMFKWEDIPQQY